MSKLFFAIVSALYLAVSAYAQTTTNRTELEGIQLPFTVQVASADSVSAEVRPFLGIWSGHWIDRGQPGLRHVLVVERTDGNQVHLIYAYGDYPAWGVVSGAVRAVGSYDSGKGVLAIKLPNGASAEYKLSTNSNPPTLTADYLLGRNVTKGVFTARTLQQPQ
jgi:hypothetical protein